MFVAAQEALGVPQGSIRATVLIETILAAFEMDEILYELREHAAGLNAGRWDYLFSVIKKFRVSGGAALPDRAQLTMTQPFMRAYTELLVRTCHRRGAHAIGGMAAFIPIRRDPEVNEMAMARVRDDKERESGDGFDGTWVAHPDLVPLATEIFDGVLGDGPNQKERLREEVAVTADQLRDLRVPGGNVTEAGVSAEHQRRAPVPRRPGSTATARRRSTTSWRTPRPPRSADRSSGNGGRRDTMLDDGRVASAELYPTIRDEELARLGGGGPTEPGWPRPPGCSTAGAGRRVRRVPDPARLPAARLSFEFERAPQRPAAPRSTNVPRPRSPTNAPSLTTARPRTKTDRTAPATSRPSYGV